MNFFRDNRKRVLLILVSAVLIVAMVTSSSGKPAFFKMASALPEALNSTGSVTS